MAIAVVGLTGWHSGEPRSDNEHPAVIRIERPRLIILKSRRSLLLYDGPNLVRRYPVDLGTHPVGDKRRAGDGRTPLGTFRIVSKNPESRYHRFLGLSYPHIPAIEAGMRAGLISPGQAAQCRRALARNGCPDWGTPLGGGVGIHGARRGVDWTAGCVALENSHIEELFDVLRVGDPVEILP